MGVAQKSATTLAPPLKKADVNKVFAEVLGLLQSKPYLTPPQWRIPTEAALQGHLRMKQYSQSQKTCAEMAPLVQTFPADVGPSLFYVPSWDYGYSPIQNTFDPEDSEGHSMIDLGVKLVARGTKIYVEDILSGSPADEAGLTAGDEIVKIDGIENPKWAQAPLKSKTVWHVRKSPTDGDLRTLALVPPSSTPLGNLDSMIARHMERSTRIISAPVGKKRFSTFPSRPPIAQSFSKL